MQKTFKTVFGNKYKVLISRKSKVNITTKTEEINFYFGNPKYIQSETEYLTNFLEHRLSIDSANEVKSYILNNI